MTGSADVPNHIGQVLGAGVLLLSMQGIPFVHASERGLVMLLPTHYYLVGGTITVAISFAILGLVPAQSIGRVFARRSQTFVVPKVVPLSLSWLSFLTLALLIYAGFAGGRDPLSNLLPLTVWTLWWVGLTLLHGLYGNLWAAINPWSGPYSLVTRQWFRAPRHDATRGFLQLPKPVGYGLAIIGFAAFAWFELISLAPENPDILATAVTI